MENFYRSTRAHVVFLMELAEFSNLLGEQEQTRIINIDQLLDNLHKLKGTADMFGYQDLSLTCKLMENELQNPKELEVSLLNQHQEKLRNSISFLLREVK